MLIRQWISHVWCLDAVIDGIREAQYPEIDFQVKNISRDEGKHMKVGPSRCRRVGWLDSAPCLEQRNKIMKPIFVFPINMY